MAEYLSNAIRDVIAERVRQQHGEDWTPEHDDMHAGGELAHAAICYADPDPYRCPVPKGSTEAKHPPRRWPWSRAWWKPKNRRADLVRAAALLIAEIERHDRASDRATARVQGEAA